MLDNERTVLKENAEELADLLTENVPYLLSHYLSKDVLTESEREAIISAGPSQEIKIKLLETLSDKKGILMEEVIEGLNATENQSVSKRINSLLSDKKPNDEDANKDGSGDKVEDVSVVATSLVDEVIAQAEDQTNLSFDEEPKEEMEALNETPAETIETVSSPDSQNAEPAGETQVDSAQMDEMLVEASVEVHKTEEAEKEVSPPEQEEPQADVPDRTVTFHENVSVNYVAASFMESDSDHQDEDDQEKVDGLQNVTASPEPENGYQSHGVDVPNESENEDVDNIDIEKEFVMPAEAESNNNVNVLEQSKLANGGRNMTRMDSNDIILDGEDKAAVNGNESPSTGDEGLDSILARKALVRNQVQKFEKTSPGQGAVKYSIRSSASTQEQPAAEAKSESGSNVKNLKNFFQKLSTSDSTTPPSGGAVKPVGKLKVTFPAS